MTSLHISGLSGRRLALLAAAAAVSAAAMGATSAFADTVSIPVIVKDTTSFYWQIVLAGARQAGKDLGVNVPQLGAQSESDINGQISILENAVAGKPAAIVISPTEFKALGTPIDEAAKSVPIIGIDSSADSKAFTSFLTTDNETGRPDRCRRPRRGDQGQDRRDQGRRRPDHLAAGRRLARPRATRASRSSSRPSIPDLKLVADKVADGQATTGLNITTDLLTANPNLVGIFAVEPDHGAGRRPGDRREQGCRQGRAGRLRQRRQDAGFLKDGTIAALVVQDPYRMGYDGVKTALAASKGEKVEANVDTGANLVTKANMNDPKIAALLHPEAGLQVAPAKAACCARSLLTGRSSRVCDGPRDGLRASKKADMIAQADGIGGGRRAGRRRPDPRAARTREELRAGAGAEARRPRLQAATRSTPSSARTAPASRR